MSSSNQSMGFEPWLKENQTIRYAAAFITLLIMCIGIVGNSLTILVILKSPRIRNVASAFIISLGAADLLFCIAVLPFNASRFLNINWIQYPVLCSIVPFFQYGNIGISLLFITMITINRYIMIVHSSLYSIVYRPIWITSMIILCIIISFGMLVPTLLGKWGKFENDPKLGSCSIVSDESGRSSKFALFITGFIIPCIVIVCCYTSIFWVVHKSEQRMRRHQLSTQSDPTVTNMQSIKRKLSEWRITKMVLAIFLSFVLCYLPITITKTSDPDVQYPALLLIAYIMVYASACFNPIIYVIMNKQYRKAFKSVLSVGCCEKATKRVPVLRSISKRLQPHGKNQEDRGFGTTVSHVSSIALESLDHNNRISSL
ncbi:G-protein coupled receptor moody isoform X1 [Myzus persicae]|uniref:G-protein coupled receptor moody isoform X1 n=1 Tax=Myzus persicae TaxID=13164 RepID=UPI000B931561|nr:G-protein coupled receptor moody isoform X1 [Myzus persicae]XP_022175887.1 G-protein coupled receptor moody isoform X1 [Myzus persicae]